MIIASRYRIEKDDCGGVYRVRNLDAPLCPSCGSLCSGYDTRSRQSIDGAGGVRRFALRRLRCPACNALHIELPDFMRPRKRYAAEVIDAVVEGRGECCPADDRTMRRWRRENHPPEMSCFLSGDAVQSIHTDQRGTNYEEG
jgi:hypothetical protein